MSQIATLFRISEQDIHEFIADPGKVTPTGIKSAAIISAEFHGSFVALEYLLGKKQPVNEKQLIGEIFNPTKILGEPLKEISDDYLKLFEMLESGKSAPYIDQQKVGLISSLLESITSSIIAARYNATELNHEKIYPCCWHDRAGSDQAFNKQHIITDFERIKDIFLVAANNRDYIISVII